jgi:hypothetical protein
VSSNLTLPALLLPVLEEVVSGGDTPWCVPTPAFELVVIVFHKKQNIMPIYPGLNDEDDYHPPVDWTPIVLGMFVLLFFVACMNAVSH